MIEGPGQGEKKSNDMRIAFSNDTLGILKAKEYLLDSFR